MKGTYLAISLLVTVKNLSSAYNPPHYRIVDDEPSKPATMNHAAVIVAGSTGFWNYRHQADASHAYQLMLQNGIPEDNIIFMMYDDVASNIHNPFPGQLFNEKDGLNVYNQSAIDYAGHNVTIENFKAVLMNNMTSSNGPVLNTDRNSKIFVYFVDHGAPGLVQFPGDKLFADELQDIIGYMYQHDLYDEMVLYFEACESGSMFPYLSDHQRVYAMTASDAEQSSWAVYCSPDDTVQDVEIGTCLGDLFSLNWMHDTEQHLNTQESLFSQYQNVKYLTDQSPVQVFGDMSFKNNKNQNYLES